MSSVNEVLSVNIPVPSYALIYNNSPTAGSGDSFNILDTAGHTVNVNLVPFSWGSIGGSILNQADLLAALTALGYKLQNSATAAQTPAATTRTYITGSGLSFAAGALIPGTILTWTFDMTKTAAGTAASTIDIAFGTTGTTADTAQVSFTKPAGTAAIDEAFIEISAVVKSVGSGTAGVVLGNFNLVHNLSATGHATIPCVCVQTTSAGFNTATVTNVGLCITTGAADAITINQPTAQAFGL